MCDLQQYDSNDAQQFLSKGGRVIVRMRGLPYDCTAQQVVRCCSNSRSFFLFFLMITQFADRRGSALTLCPRNHVCVWFAVFLLHAVVAPVSADASLSR